MRVIVGDVGGSNCRLACYEDGQVKQVFIQSTQESGGLDKAVNTYLQKYPGTFDAGCVAVAGPVKNNQAVLTNVNWHGSGTDFPCVGKIVNDLEAAAVGTRRIAPEDCITLHDADPCKGPEVVIGVGTGHGLAWVFGTEVYPTESGHAEYAPPSAELRKFSEGFADKNGRIRIEDVVSGMGIANLLEYAHSVYGGSKLPNGVAAGAFVLENANKNIACSKVLDWFALSLGSIVGDVVTRSLAKTVWLCGGVSQKWASVLQRPAFKEGLYNKKPMISLIESCRVHVAMHPHLGLLGAAAIATELCEQS